MLNCKFIVYCLLLCALMANNTPTNAQDHNGQLPHQLTPAEQQQMPAYLQHQRANRSVAQPPASAVRTPAEWEETQGLLITWTSYPTILREIVRYAREECTVYIVTDNATSTQNYLTAGGVSLNNVVFLNEPYNSVWICDYGPWSVYTNDVDTLSIVDWVYNRPRPADDAIPQSVADYLTLPFYETATPYELVHTGGNYMVDGLGTAFSSKLILDENPSLSNSQIDQIMHSFMGIDRYVKMETLPYDGIHHIDMHLKLLDEETLLVGQYPSGVSDGPQIEANINYILNNYQTPFGNPYKIVRIPMPPDASNDYPNNGGDYRTFTNCVFINKTVLVPTYEQEYDTTALRILQEQLPGYRIQGIDCNGIISASGALHCITKLVHTANPLLIAHPRLRDTYFVADRTVTARIQHRSGINNATLYWTSSLTDPPLPYQIPMTLTDPINNLWTATLPAQAAGATISYYIEAVANSGKTQVRPLTAPEGMYSYRVLPLTAPPTALFTASATQVCTGQLLSFTDASTAGITQWQWSFDGGTPATSTQQYPTVSFATAGNHTVTLSVTNALGTNSFSQTISVTELIGNQPFLQDFTDGIGTVWSSINPQSDAYTWELTTGVTCAQSAVAINNYENDNTGTEDVLSATFDLTNLSNTTLTFRVAYAPYNNTYADRLQVRVSTCGTQAQILYNKAGNTLATAPAQSNAAFEPNGCTQWRTETVDLSAFDGQIITINLVDINGYGNYLYLDDIAITGNASNPPITVKAKIWLAGAYLVANAQMSNTLNTNNLLPLEQPFNREPWQYTGTETLNTMPAGVTDWVLIELHNANNPLQIVAQRAALLYTDGSIRDIDGTNGVNFYGINTADTYYIAIKHRNHVGVISSIPISLPNNAAYDFTTSLDAVLHPSQLKPLASGIYGLFAADVDANGVVNVADFNRYVQQLSTTGYKDADLNFDGTVTPADFMLYLPNASQTGTQEIRE